LQHGLTGAIDAAELQGVLSDLGGRPEAHSIMRHRRLADLGSADTVHSWLWAVNPAHGFVLHPDDYVTALRLRLGLDAAEYMGAEPCGECEQPVTADDFGPHALLCARGRRTVGHNRIRDHLADLARASDSRVQTEVQWAAAVGCADARVDARRPADIVTSAVPLGGVGYVALDVGVTTPHTMEAVKKPDLDVLDAYHKAKTLKYADAAREAKWQYRPVIVSAFGRVHSDAKNVVHRLALAAARRYGVKSATMIETAWWRNCSTLLMERASSMVARCRPTVRLPATLGAADDDRAGLRHVTRIHGAECAVVVGADAPTPPASE
jgi:hypothetical protein